jgi:hypothetical protein
VDCTVPDGGSLAFHQYTVRLDCHPKGVMVSHGNVMHTKPWLCRVRAAWRTSCTFGFRPITMARRWAAAPLFGGFRCILMSPTAFIRPFRWLQAIRVPCHDQWWPNLAYDLTRKIASS